MSPSCLPNRDGYGGGQGQRGTGAQDAGGEAQGQQHPVAADVSNDGEPLPAGIVAAVAVAKVVVGFIADYISQGSGACLALTVRDCPKKVSGYIPAGILRSPFYYACLYALAQGNAEGEGGNI